MIKIMQTTGIIRRVDDLGRIVIAKDIRKQLNISEGDSMEFFISGESVIIRKYSEDEFEAVKLLSPRELRQAYELQQHEYDKSDIENELDIASEDYIVNFDIDRRPVTEEEIDRMAHKLRRILNQDADACWSSARVEAVTAVLSERTKYVIRKITNGVSANDTECFLDENGNEMVFNSIDSAEEFLDDCGLEELEIEFQGIKIEEV